MHKEYKEELHRVRNACFLSDLFEQFTPKDVSLAEVIQQVVGVVLDKGERYEMDRRAGLDILVRWNLRHVWGIKDIVWPDLSELEAQGWCSVIRLRVGAGTSCVIAASENAADFLKSALGRLRINVMDFDGVV